MVIVKVPHANNPKANPIEHRFESSDAADVSDGYHTMAELYDHRIQLWITVCRLKDHLMRCCEVGHNSSVVVWKSYQHADGTFFEGWFLLGISVLTDEQWMSFIGGEDTLEELNAMKAPQLTYHLPNMYWDVCDVTSLARAPEWDGHTSKDVLDRLKRL